MYIHIVIGDAENGDEGKMTRTWAGRSREKARRSFEDKHHEIEILKCVSSLHLHFCF
jgi:hypothetical protein